MDAIFLMITAILCVLTAAMHSYFGERRLVIPLIKSGHGVMASPLAKQVIRFAWHWTSLLWILIAAYLAFAAQGHIAHRPLLLGIGFFHLIAGLVDGIFTGGKHIGWPPITLIGVLVLMSCF